MFDLVRKEIHSIFQTENSIKDQIRKYKTRKKELDRDNISTFVYVRSDLMSKIIKSSRGEKGKGKKKKGSFLKKIRILGYMI